MVELKITANDLKSLWPELEEIAGKVAIIKDVDIRETLLPSSYTRRTKHKSGDISDYCCYCGEEVRFQISSAYHERKYANYCPRCGAKLIWNTEDVEEE